MQENIENLVKCIRNKSKTTLPNSAQVLWNNNKIRYRNNCIFIPWWIKHGITFVFSDNMTENGQISYNKVIAKIQDSGITKFEFNCVKNALLKYENILIEQQQKTMIFFNWWKHSYNYQNISKQIQKKSYFEPEIKWQHGFPNIQNLNLTEMWSIVPNCTKDSKLILLQWKILHKIYPTYKYLF